MAGHTLDTTTRVPEEEWFNAKANHIELLEEVRQWTGARTLHLLDLFSKAGVAYWEWLDEGYHAGKCDICDPFVNYDILSRRGFKNILRHGLSLKEGGIVIAAPPCSMFIYLSSSIHRRNKLNPAGDTSIDKVRMANLIAENTAWLLEWLAGREIFIVVEQPQNSMTSTSRSTRSFCAAIERCSLTSSTCRTTATRC